jgi:hypothetical protein
MTLCVEAISLLYVLLTDSKHTQLFQTVGILLSV